jgi:YidC/Oxa1 family membrane protein insertase
MLDPLYQVIGWLLAFFYGLVPNLGIAIILLTVTVMLVLFPLTAKQARSMLAMQEIQPELKKIQAKYKGDRQKLVDEQQRLFQEHKVNPLGGCLPLLAQFPVFISLFQVLRTTYKHIPVDSKLFGDLCGAHETVKACGAAKGFPKHLEFLSMDLSVSALDAEGALFSVLPYFVLVALVVLSGYLQSRQTQRTTPKGGANQQMLIIGKVLPVVFGVISLNFPAGLVVYFFVSNVWRLGQQEVIFRHIHLPHRERQAAKRAGHDGERTKDRTEDRSEPEAREPEAREPEAREPEAPEPKRAGGPERKPASRSEPRPAAAGGGLRGLFRLPPAPNGEPANARPPPPPAPAKPRPQPKAAASGSRSNRGRKRRNNKKRKR